MSYSPQTKSILSQQSNCSTIFNTGKESLILNENFTADYESGQKQRQREFDIEFAEHQLETEQNDIISAEFNNKIASMDILELRKILKTLEEFEYTKYTQHSVHKWNAWEMNQIKQKIVELEDAPTWLQREQKPIELQSSYDDAAKQVLNQRQHSDMSSEPLQLAQPTLLVSIKVFEDPQNFGNKYYVINDNIEFGKFDISVPIDIALQKYNELLDMDMDAFKENFTPKQRVGLQRLSSSSLPTDITMDEFMSRSWEPIKFHSCAVLEKEMESLPYVWERPEDPKEKGTCDASLSSISYEKQLEQWTEQVANHIEQKNEMMRKHHGVCDCYLNYYCLRC
jgi:hypothetical protein